MIKEIQEGPENVFRGCRLFCSKNVLEMQS